MISTSGGEESKTGQREKLKRDAAATEASATPGQWRQG